ncbi:MAG: hypothetical protein EKK57_08335 [Proteobacteria bacterium]|nr:MAG: hypothetical protein EKK57_08335 [Pseudomonadota bacterium]
MDAPLTEVPKYILTETEHDFIIYFRENYLNFASILVDAFKDWETFSTKLNVCEEELTILRVGFFNGYKVANDRFGREITEGIDLDEPLPFQSQVAT